LSSLAAAARLPSAHASSRLFLKNFRTCVSPRRTPINS
jgi:hypothetical protein